MKLTMISTPNCAECSAAKQMLEARGHEIEKVLVGEEVNGKVIDLEFIMNAFNKRQVPQFLSDTGVAIHGGYDGALKFIKENS